MTTKLHYIYDPLCGWCYAAAPLAAAAAELDGLELVLDAGGLWPEPTRLPESTRRYIQQADARIAALSGQPFGAAYLSGSLLDPALTLDSAPVIAAVIAAEALDPTSGLRMLRGIQRAHYVEGLRVVEAHVLCDVAVGCLLDRDAFSAQLEQVDAHTHIAATQALMRRVGARGFPTFVLEHGGTLHGVPHDEVLGNATGFVVQLDNARARVMASAAT